MTNKVSLFFQNLSFVLDVNCAGGEWTEVREPYFGDPTDDRVSASINFDLVEVFQRDKNEARSLYAEEWASVAYHLPEITLTSHSFYGKGWRETFYAPNKRNFSVRDLLEAVQKWENGDRPRRDKFGEIDFSHVYYEGLREESEDGVWTVCWGS